MANGQDRAVGASLLAVSTALFVYYTIWALVIVCGNRSSCSRAAAVPPPLRGHTSVGSLRPLADRDRFPITLQPFVDEGHPLHDLFPPRKYATLVPAVVLLLAATVVSSFLALVMIKSRQKKPRG